MHLLVCSSIKSSDLYFLVFWIPANVLKDQTLPRHQIQKHSDSLVHTVPNCVRPDSKISTLERGLKKLRICTRIRQICVDERWIWKENVADAKISRCVCTGPKTRDLLIKWSCTNYNWMNFTCFLKKVDTNKKNCSIDDDACADLQSQTITLDSGFLFPHTPCPMLFCRFKKISKEKSTSL